MKQLLNLAHRLIRRRYVGKPAVHVVSGIAREGIFSTSVESELYFVEPAFQWKPGIWVDFRRIRWDRDLKCWIFHD